MRKTPIKLSGENGNIFHLVGIARKALNNDGKKTEAQELVRRLFSCKSYTDALILIREYCDIK